MEETESKGSPGAILILSLALLRPGWAETSAEERMLSVALGPHDALSTCRYAQVRVGIAQSRCGRQAQSRRQAWGIIVQASMVVGSTLVRRGSMRKGVIAFLR